MNRAGALGGAGRGSWSASTATQICCMTSTTPMSAPRRLAELESSCSAADQHLLAIHCAALAVSMVSGSPTGALSPEAAACSWTAARRRPIRPVDQATEGGEAGGEAGGGRARLVGCAAARRRMGAMRAPRSHLMRHLPGAAGCASQSSRSNQGVASSPAVPRPGRLPAMHPAPHVATPASARVHNEQQRCVSYLAGRRRLFYQQLLMRREWVEANLCSGRATQRRGGVWARARSARAAQMRARRRRPTVHIWVAHLGL